MTRILQVKKSKEEPSKGVTVKELQDIGYQARGPGVSREQRPC